ncbi:hypothetical protein EVAR_101920_1 [Eumeta japonica]|uniref:Uncharacterized protein n=1 Tax=Eumeta variegata TaxID=151549 RepID=A0A4C1TSL3_EUMVA|nr:hypothetical protein EVAR_101920_1 [Eumeta japonica]
MRETHAHAHAHAHTHTNRPNLNSERTASGFRVVGSFTPRFGGRRPGDVTRRPTSTIGLEPVRAGSAVFGGDRPKVNFGGSARRAVIRSSSLC